VLHFLLSEILDPQYKKLPAMTHFINTQGCIALTQNPEYYAHTKHNDIHNHFVREKVEGGEESLECTPTGAMVADCFAKDLTGEKLVQHRANMGIFYFQRQLCCIMMFIELWLIVLIDSPCAVVTEVTLSRVRVAGIFPWARSVIYPFSLEVSCLMQSLSHLTCT